MKSSDRHCLSWLERSEIIVGFDSSGLNDLVLLPWGLVWLGLHVLHDFVDNSRQLDVLYLMLDVGLIFEVI